MAIASTGVNILPFTPVKLPLSRVVHFKVMVVGLGVANTVLLSPLCADPMLPLEATLAILKAKLDSPLVELKDKGCVKVELAICCTAQHATPHSTAQYPCALQLNASQV